MEEKILWVIQIHYKMSIKFIKRRVAQAGKLLKVKIRNREDNTLQQINQLTGKQISNKILHFNNKENKVEVLEIERLLWIRSLGSTVRIIANLVILLNRILLVVTKESDQI
jgi:hypothetical protein